MRATTTPGGLARRARIILLASQGGQRLCVMMDNLNTRLNAAALDWLARHPRVSFHYTPTHACWVNMVECFFSILTRQGLHSGMKKWQ